MAIFQIDGQLLPQQKTEMYREKSHGYIPNHWESFSPQKRRVVQRKSHGYFPNHWASFSPQTCRIVQRKITWLYSISLGKCY